jgi:hypothetical protein
MEKTDKFWDENEDLLMKSEMGEEFTQEECDKVLMCWYGTHLENEDLANEIKILKTRQNWQPIETVPLRQYVICLWGTQTVGCSIFYNQRDVETTYAKYWIPMPPTPELNERYS